MEKMKTAFGMGSPEGGIYDILKSEHRQVKASLMEIINSGRVMKDVFSQTVTALDQHLKGEESLLYPRLDRISDTRMMAIKAYEEHHLSRLVITDINSAPEDEKWLVKVQVLYDILDRHIDMEENHMFPMAKKSNKRNRSYAVRKRLPSTNRKANAAATSRNRSKSLTVSNCVSVNRCIKIAELDVGRKKTPKQLTFRHGILFHVRR